MHSLSNSTKWPSYESLPSTSSFLLSESDQTEDEADVFSSEGEGECGGSKSFSSSLEGLANARLGQAFVGEDGSFRMSGKSQVEGCPNTTTYPSLVLSPEPTATLDRASTSEGDLAFAHKCADLQRFIRPVMELLKGLKTGRYERGLSSFQQSVAMDRLQRILGILQKPDMGERYLRTLLQVEMMLKVWFPQVVKETPAPSTQNVIPIAPPRWHRNQLHMPVKKRKLSWLDSDFPSANSPSCKRQQRDQPEVNGQIEIPWNKTTKTLPVPSGEQTSSLRTDNRVAEQARWTNGHESYINTSLLSKPSYLCSRTDKVKGKQLPILLVSPCGSPATQDCFVSSSILVNDTPQLLLPGQLPLRYHSQLVNLSARDGAKIKSDEIKEWSVSVSLRPCKQEEEETHIYI
ncbi:circadian associated repressor of transcription a [Aplochiton taeniatus]